MADEPDDLTIRILREIQATLFNHDLRFEQIDRRFEQIEGRLEKVDTRLDRMQRQMDYRFDTVDRRLQELNDLMIKASGEATQASVRHDMVQRQIAGVEMEIGDLRARLQKLEEKA